jgi:phenylpropionate dioxygenase-like ring-hydroxylating dioxygenase large terminal subunit
MVGNSPPVAAYLAALEPFWHPVLPSRDLTNTPRVTTLLGRQIALARLGGVPVAFDDVCRHMGAALSRGRVEDGRFLRCGYHGWLYDCSGRCVDIPARRTAAIPVEARVAAYACQEALGLIWVCLSPTPARPLPAFPEFDDATFRCTPVRQFEAWSASINRMVMAALDDSHFPWVHPGVLGDPARPDPPEHTAWVDNAGEAVVSTYSMEQPANNSLIENGAAALEPVTYWNYATVNSIRQVKQVPAGTYIVFNAYQPVDHNATISYTILARNYDCDPSRDAQYLDFNLVVKNQDQPVVEGQRPWLLPPMSSHLMLYVRPADLPIVVYQKWLEDLGIPQL